MKGTIISELCNVLNSISVDFFCNFIACLLYFTCPGEYDDHFIARDYKESFVGVRGLRIEHGVP